MDAYDLSGACQAIESFFDALTNWYIRRSRDRFWGTGGGDGGADQQRRLRHPRHRARGAVPGRGPAAAAGHRVGVARADRHEAGASVHLTDWPAPADLPADPELVRAMDRVREVCSAAHSVRKAQALRARLPLASLTVAAPDAASLAPFRDLIADEVNVKEVHLTSAVDEVADRDLTVVFKVAAPRLGPATPKVAAAAKRGDWEQLDGGRARVGDATLEPGEFELRLRPRAEAVSRALPGDDGLVILDVEVTSGLGSRGTGPRPGPHRAASPPRARPAGQRPHPPGHRRAGPGRRGRGRPTGNGSRSRPWRSSSRSARATARTTRATGTRPSCRGGPGRIWAGAPVRQRWAGSTCHGSAGRAAKRLVSGSATVQDQPRRSRRSFSVAVRRKSRLARGSAEAIDPIEDGEPVGALALAGCDLIELAGVEVGQQRQDLHRPQVVVALDGEMG